MSATIFFDNGKFEVVNNLSEVIQHESGLYSNKETFTSENFRDFQLYDTNYSFVGDETISVNGNHIHHVTFE